MMAVGIDMGSSRFVVAVAKKGGVEILCNKSSNRTTAGVVGYGKQRVIGDQAKSQIKKNFKNSVRYPMRFLTPRFNQYNYEREFSFSKTKVNDRANFKELNFIVNYNGEQKEFSSRQVVAGLFADVVDILDYNKSDVRDVVVSVPSFFTQIERQAVIEAGKAAGLKIQRLYNESTANVMNYGIFRKRDLSDDTPRTVGFVDVGHSKTSVFFAKIWKNKAEILYEKNLLNVGTRSFDLNLLNIYLDKFEKENNISEHRESPKAKIRLLDAIEKQRKILSANAEAGINVECIFEDYDFSYNMTREDFEKVNQCVIDQIRDLLLKSITESKIDLKELHSVEIIGGGSRIPIVQTMIHEIMNQQCSKTLDATESISRGCAIKAAMVSPLFKVVDYDIKDRSHYAVKVGIKYKSDNEEVIKAVFKEGSSFENTVSLTINRDEEVDVRLFYQDKYDNDNLVLISSAHLPKCDAKTKEFKCKLYFELDNHGIAKILKYEVTEKEDVKVKDDKKIVVEKPEKDDEKDDEKDKKDKKDDKKIKIEEPVKTKEVFKTRKIELDLKEHLMSTPEEMGCLMSTEAHINEQQTIIANTLKAKYNLESFIYDTREMTQNSNNKLYLNSSEGETILKACMEKEDWLYSDGREAKLEEYISQRETLNSLASGLYTRKDKHTKIESFADNARKGFSEFNTVHEQSLLLVKPEKRTQLDNNFQKGMEMIGEMFVVKNNISPNSLDEYNYNTQSKQINQLFNEMLDIVTAAKEAEKQRLKVIEEEKKKAEREAKKIQEEEEKKKKDTKIETEEPVKDSDPIQIEKEEDPTQIQTEN